MVLEPTDLSTWRYKFMFTGTLQGRAFCPRACQCQPHINNRYINSYNWPHACLYRIYYIIFWGRGTGVYDFVTLLA